MDTDKLLEDIVEKLNYSGSTVAVAESCTGGMISARLVDYPGISAYFAEGYVTYSNEAKVKNLGVSQDSLDDYGAVSHEVAKQMAEGVKKRANATYGIATTGIAGPTGGSEEKPVGLVYIALATPTDTKVMKCNFSGNRSQVRTSACTQALELLLEQLKEA